MDGSVAVAVTPLNIDKSIHILKISNPATLFAAQFVTHTPYSSRSALGNNAPLASPRARLPIFSPDSMVDIIVLKGYYLSVGRAITQLMVISTRQLINACRTHLHRVHEPQNESAANLMPITLEWDDWGPLATWRLPCGMKLPSKRPNYGSRLLVRARLDHKKLQYMSDAAIKMAPEGVKWRLILLDFNPRLFSCATTEEKTRVEEQVNLLMTEISRHSAKDPMITSVKSGLGYRATLIQHDDVYLNAYLDGDDFVGRKVRFIYHCISRLISELRSEHRRMASTFVHSYHRRLIKELYRYRRPPLHRSCISAVSEGLL
jgi:hypothetical protein